MASLNYLWKNQARFPICSKQFIKAWGKRIFSIIELLKRNMRRTILVQNGAHINECAEIGKLTIDGSKSNLSIGAFSFIGRVYMASHDKIIIGDRVCINDGVQFLTASHSVSDSDWKRVKAPIIIDDYAWIATGAIILPGVHIGKGAVVGAGAVVSKSVLPNEIVAGNPAKPIHKKRCSVLEYNPCEFLAANRAWLVG
ncbi:acyltransferase [Spirosoma agri]|uniref:Acyltransferase n=1 Tax=Spirosoma agri TaxID=1987381 RepID=A0A6M0IHW9_9BACT|nr:acyltransferase [Spirosoma agri]NEU67442.1 acyltransferase [Spirosoma agri]